MILRRVSRLEIGDIVKHGEVATMVVAKVTPFVEGMVVLTLHHRPIPMDNRHLWGRELNLTLHLHDLIELIV